MPTIKKTYEMNASAEEVFAALVNPEIIKKWSGEDATMGAKVGDKFIMWGGQMFGKNLEVIPNIKLVQEWCYEQWKTPSKVTFSIKSNGKTSAVELIHEGVPDDSVNEFSEGWNTHYLGSIQDMFNKNKS